MPEARDMLTRPNNGVTETYDRQRTSIASIGILPNDDDSERSINLTPFRWNAAPLTGGGSGQQTGESLSTRTTTRIVLFETPMPVYRRGSRSQNTPPSATSSRRGRVGRLGARSLLPSWYPRTPLGDITHVVRAIERRRLRLGDGAGRISGRRMDHQPADQDPSLSDAQLEHQGPFVTPKPKLASKMFKQSTLGMVPLMLAAVANKCEGESELQTPQKKLLNSIEIVEKVVMEELHRLKRTPTAKKAEREKRVRTLMMKMDGIVRFFLGSVPCLAVSSPELAKEFLRTYEASYLDRPKNSTTVYLTYGSKDFMFAPYGPYWKLMKKLVMSELLNDKTLDLLLPVRQDEVNRFINLLSHKAKGGKPVDVKDELLKLTNNVISRMLMSERCSEEENEASDMRKLHEDERRKKGTDEAKDLLDILLKISEDDTMEMKLTKDNIKASDIPNLPYLQAVVKETLRLHPTAPIIPRTSTEDCIVGGYHVPAKTTVLLTFGPSVDVRGQHFHMLPFGSGRRMCPGTSLAMQMVQVTLGVMVQCFEWKAGEKGDVAQVDMDEGPGITLPRANPLVCVPVARLNSTLF
ncbi:hypothetical protein L1987_60000 [Smallanthus sonchifolius]|uniref:Uncharacterized protein n=1 Tax=Smallanthus sonchifolius TaxID=185202 RepID=A0ACB9D715_9ASTR|nr:hypothetical protein L1987_60000 [Smallanthus sonchifolius]